VGNKIRERLGLSSNFRMQASADASPVVYLTVSIAAPDPARYPYKEGGRTR